MVLFHVAAVAAFWFFTWTNVLVALVLHWLAVGFGISLGYHRLHTHRGYKTSKAFEYFLAVCGTLTLEGGPIFWVATHRVHHQHSDQEGDPHTPRDGGFWAHMGWILFGDTHHNNTRADGASTRRISARDPFYRWLNTYHYVPLTHARASILLAVGGWPMVLWGIVLRVVVRPARDLAGELGDAHVGQPPLRDARRLAQQLVGGAPDVRRGLAQQPPRPPGLGAPRPGLVRVRHQLDHAEAVRRDRRRARPEGREGPRAAAGEKRPELPVQDFRLKPEATKYKVWLPASAGSSRILDDMISGRRRSVIFFTVLGICLVALAVTLNVSWIVLNWRRGVLAVLGVIFFLLIIAGMVLNTIFLVREIRRNEQHDSFINAVTHELKTPVASIRLYLQTLQTRELDEDKRREFYRIMLEDSDRLLHTIEQVLRAGSAGSRLRRSARARVNLARDHARVRRARADALPG